jgi:hypothetical protein
MGSTSIAAAAYRRRTMSRVDDAAAAVAKSSSSSGCGGNGGGGGGGGSVADGGIECAQAAPKEPQVRCTAEAAAANSSHDPVVVGNDAGFQFAGDVNAGGDRHHPIATGGVPRDSNRWNISSSESDDDGGVDGHADDDNENGVDGGGRGTVRRRSAETFPHIALELSSPLQLPATPSASAPAIELASSAVAAVESTLQPSSLSTVSPSAMLPLLASALLSQPQPTSSSFSQTPFIFTAAHPTSSIVSTPLPPPSHFLPHRLKKPGWKSESSRRRRGSDIGGDEPVGGQEVEQNHKNMMHRGYSVKQLPAPVFGKGEDGENAAAEVEEAGEEVVVLTGGEGTGGNAVDIHAKAVSDGGGGSTSTAAADPKAIIQRLEVEKVSIELKKRRDLVITGGVWRLICD